MRRSDCFAAASVAVLMLAGGPSLAQTVSDLRIGASVGGVLTDQDASVSGDDGDYRYDDYRVTARAGQRLEAVMRAADFDAYLEIMRDGETEVLASDDDGLGDGTDSRLRFTVPSNGTYVLRARTLSGLEGGDYSLSLSERGPPPRAPRPRGIGVGDRISGELTDGDPLNDDDARYDAYALRLREGQRVAITLTSDPFDTVVRVGRTTGGVFDELAMNDDARGELNSYLVFTAPAAGEYVIRAGALNEDGLGAYTLTLEDGPPPIAAQSIAIGDSVTGELAASDGLNDQADRADVYRFTATAGQRIEARLDSDEFDAWLELYDAAGSSLMADDDGGDDTNSRLVTTLAEGGEYSLQVRAIGETLLGGYTLTLSEGVPEPEPTTLPFGEVQQGEIGEADPRDEENRGFDSWRFSGTAGNRVQIVMRSGDFDTYLQVAPASEGGFEAVASDDDGLGEGTDSRLNYDLPETGDYVVRASPLGAEEDGLYSIELLDRGPKPVNGSILIGATARGTLSDLDAIADDGALFDAYEIEVKAGDELEITLVSNDFDAYLDIGKENEASDEDAGWTSLASDDDSLSDTHAKVEWSVEDSGVHVIRARSFGTAQTGSYALTVTRKP